MVIDFHTHTFPKKIVKRTIEILSDKAHMAPSLEGTGEGLLESMSRHHVDFSVTFSVATKVEQVEMLNDIAIENVSDSHLIYFGSMHPMCETYEKELERLSAAGVKGVKIHPVYQGYALTGSNFYSIFKKCVELNLIVITHAGMDIGFPEADFCGPDRIRKVMEDFPELKLVAAHMGGWKQWDKSKELLKDTPVILDSSFSFNRINARPGEKYYSEEELLLLNKEEFIKMVETFGSKRILFGTDSPWTGQAESIDFIRSLEISSEEKNDILGKNAKKLLEI